MAERRRSWKQSSIGLSWATLKLLPRLLVRPVNSSIDFADDKHAAKTQAMLASIEERSAKIDTSQDDSEHLSWDGFRRQLNMLSVKTVADARRLVDDFLARSRALQTLLATTIKEEDDDLANMYLTAKAEGKPRSTQDVCRSAQLPHSANELYSTPRQNCCLKVSYDA